MKRYTFFLFFVLILGPVSAGAEFNSQEEIGKWLTFYYQNPEPEKLVPAVRYMSENGFLNDGKAYPPIFGFIAGVFKQNQSEVKSWANDLSSLDDTSYGVIVLGLWYANLSWSKESVYAMLEKRQSLKEQFNYLYHGSPMGITDIPLEQGAWVLDALWGNFMATGSKEPVVRIMQALPWLDVKGDVNRLLVGGAAQWSLTSNAIQHKKVMAICEDEAFKQSPEVQEKLEAVVAEAKQKPNQAPQRTPKSGAAEL